MRVAISVRVSPRLPTQTQTMEPQSERWCTHIAAPGWHLPESHIFRDDG